MLVGLSLTAGALMGCHTAPPSPSHDADVAAIRRVSAEWLSALRRQDAARMLDLMTDDAVLMAPGMPVVRGKEAAKSLYAQLFAQFARIDEQVAIEEIVVAGDWAFSWGSETLTLTPAAGGAAIELRGSGMSVLRRAPDGAWKFARAINNDLPRAAVR
jgi:uncharacterized protein (TIGR02246 family)